MSTISTSVLATSISVFTAFPLAAAQPVEGPSAFGKSGMVVTVSKPATDVGLDVLKKGGNAVDASVAVAFALAVTWPEAGNIGGGGFMMVYPGGKEKPVVVDYREIAPAAATATMFDTPKPPPPYLTVGVPGTVRGLSTAHLRSGKLPWKELVLPAVKLAEDGIVIDAPLAASLNEGLQNAQNNAELLRVYGKNGGKERWKAGDRLVQPDLARTLRLIADKGPDAFYRGEIADLIVTEMKAGKGLITKADLVDDRTIVREPIHGTFRGHDIYAPPPPSSGGICMVQMLNVLENFDLKKQGRWSPETLHLLTEAMRRAYCDRARSLGDPAFVKISAELITKEYAKKLAESVDLKRATRSEDLAKDIPLDAEGSSTTHFSVIDKNGMAVSNTYTLESSFGSKIVVKGAGFLLNNEMVDFNPRPGKTTRAGQIGTLPNQIAPGKRMLSSQTPTIVMKDGKVVLITGSPGGRTIINTVTCMVLNVLEFDMPLREAVDAPRVHHQWFPNAIKMESALHNDHKATLEKLRALGHKIDAKPARQGDAHSIRVDPKTGEYEGAADKRRSGWAAGY